MCIAVPGKVVSIDDKSAKVDFWGVLREVSLELLDNVQIGDYVMVHAGYAIEKIKLENAEEIIRLYKEIEELEQ